MANGARPTVTEVSDRQVHYLRNPPSPSFGVCEICSTFCTGYPRCYRCGHNPNWITAMAPISMSVHMGQLHDLLRGYKGLDSAQGRLLRRDLAAWFWRFLRDHEACLARQCGVERFDVVTTVPSSSVQRDADHPLRRIISAIVGPTSNRYERLLLRSDADVAPRVPDPAKYDVQRHVDGESILLIDDTWASGSNAQSAAGALVMAGARAVGVVVAGRHVHDDFSDHGERLRELPRRFNWNTCVFHA